MKDKTQEIEGHHTEVDLDEHKSTFLSPSATPTTTTTNINSINNNNSSSAGNSVTIANQSNSFSSSKASNVTSSSSSTTSIKNKSSTSSTSSESSSSNNNNNFDDDYNEWDISIGDLIIDLDADIERQTTSEGDKQTTTNISTENKINFKNNNQVQQNNKNSHNNLHKKQAQTQLNQNNNNNNQRLEQTSGMSSNFKLNRLGPLAAPSSGSCTSSSASSNNNSNNIAAGTASSTSSAIATGSQVSATASGTTNGSDNNNGGTSGGGGLLNRHSHVNNARNSNNNYSVSSLNVSSSAGLSTPSNKQSLNSSLIEHNANAKSIKMKIKRKNIGGKISEINHEIVSSDSSPGQNCTKSTYISSIDQTNSSSLANLASTNNNSSSSSTISSANETHIPTATNSTTNNTSLQDTTNSVIIVADSEELSSMQDSSSSHMSSKSTKHSNKNKNGHRDKKDKTNRLEKEKQLNFANNPVQASTNIIDNDDLVSSTLNAPANATSTPMKQYPNSTVINIKQQQQQQEAINSKKPKSDKTDDHISDQVDVGTMTSIATITEPDCLGPCEPGTSVMLEGIVWQETENGVLVVNVTWRGKTYVGTLLDCTKHDWAPPRFCESPTSDIESKSMKNTRGKRARNSFITENSIDTRSVTSKLRNGKGRRTANSGYVPTSPAKNDSVLNTSKRKGRPSELDLNEESANKRSKVSKMDGCDVQPNSPVLIECPEPNCSKKYRHINGLKYHQSHAHFGSTFNVTSDSQECFETTPTSETNLNKGDVSDSDNNDSSNVLDSPLKIVDKSSSSNLESISKANDNSTETNDQPNTSGSSDSKKFLKNSANESLVSDSNNINGTDNHENSNKPSFLSNAKNEPMDNDLLDNKFDKKESMNKSDVENTESANANSNGDNNDQHATSDSNNSKLSAEMENVASPAYSDISDDNSTNDNVTTGATGANSSLSNSSMSASTATTEKTNEFLDSKKIPNLNNYNMSTLQNYFNKSQYLIPNHSTESKPNDLKMNESSNEIDNGTEQRPGQGPSYGPYSYRFCPSSSNEFNKTTSNNNSSMDSSPTNKNESDSLKDSKNNEFNNSIKPPNSIVELQNLKNRIQYTFDQSSMYDMQKQKFPTDSERDKASISSKDKSKYSPQLKKSTKDNKDDNSIKDNKNKHEEGMKPTMETTGPPTLTNGYYYNSSFLPPSFSPFDTLFRGNSMNPVMMGPPYVPPSGSSPFLHPQMRFPHMNPLDGMPGIAGNPAAPAPPPPPPPNVSRTSTAPSSHSMNSSSTSKTSNHSFNHSNSNKMLSPTSVSSCVPSSSHSSMPLSASNYKSSSKEFSSPGLNSVAPNHNVGGGLSTDPQRPPLSAAGSLHGQPPRHPLHTSAIGYPIFDPYSAMIVNHPVQANHQFTPK